MKCDRAQPCVQCLKSGRECTFASRLPPRKESINENQGGNAGKSKRPRFEQSIEGGGSEHQGRRLGDGNGWTPNDFEIPFERSERSKSPADSEGPLSRTFVKRDRSKYLTLGDRILMLDHVSRALFDTDL